MTNLQWTIRLLQIQTERLSERIDLYIGQAQGAQDDPERYDHFLNRIDVTMRVYQEKVIRLAELMDREAQS